MIPRDAPPSLFRASQADGITAYYGGSGDVVSSTGTPTVDQLHAVPLYSGPGGTIDRIGFNVTTGGAVGSVARCGLYEGSLVTLAPTALVVDSGEFDTTATGLKEATINKILDPERLYFLAFLCGVAAPTCTTMTSGWHIFGRNTSLNAQFGRVKTGFAYAALPTTFPSGLGMLTTAAVMVVLRYLKYARPQVIPGVGLGAGPGWAG